MSGPLDLDALSQRVQAVRDAAAAQQVAAASLAAAQVDPTVAHTRPYQIARNDAHRVWGERVDQLRAALDHGTVLALLDRIRHLEGEVADLRGVELALIRQRDFLLDQREGLRLRIAKLEAAS